MQAARHHTLRSANTATAADAAIDPAIAAAGAALSAAPTILTATATAAEPPADELLY